jgi:DNA-binding Xre family transcriptional regulator
MGRKKASRPVISTSERVLRERALRAKYQRRRPSLSSLVSSGDYTAPVPQSEVLSLMRFAARIKARRQEMRISLAQLAALTGIDKAALSRLENGQAENPTYSTLNRVANALNKRLCLVLEDDGPGRTR